MIFVPAKQKVLFSQACHSVRGGGGGGCIPGCAWAEAVCIPACTRGGGGQCGGDVWTGGLVHTPGTDAEACGTHPTRMHSCVY